MLNRYNLYTLIFSAVLFGAITLVGESFNSFFDEDEHYGFPFEFYTNFGGYREFEIENFFSIWALLFDILFAFIIILIFKFVVKPKKH